MPAQVQILLWSIQRFFLPSARVYLYATTSATCAILFSPFEQRRRTGGERDRTVYAGQLPAASPYKNLPRRDPSAADCTGMRMQSTMQAGTHETDQTTSTFESSQASKSSSSFVGSSPAGSSDRASSSGRRLPCVAPSFVSLVTSSSSKPSRRASGRPPTTSARSWRDQTGLPPD